MMQAIQALGVVGTTGKSRGVSICTRARLPGSIAASPLAKRHGFGVGRHIAEESDIRGV